MPTEAAGILDGEITSDDIENLAEVDLAAAPPKVVAAIIEALNGADEAVKAEFEAEINVFSGTFDTYTPAGSNVTVAQRRTIVAVTALTASPLAVVSGRKRK